MSTLTLPASSFDPILCATCGGRCCQAHPGMWIDPKRFFSAYSLPEASTPAELARHLPPELVLRDLLGIAVPSPRRNDDGCLFHSATGCQLAAAARPCQCLALVPDVTTQMEGEILCRLLPGYGSDIAHQNWQKWWQRHRSLQP